MPKTKTKSRESREDIPEGINVTKRDRGDSRPQNKGRAKFGAVTAKDQGGEFELLASTYTDESGTVYEYEKGTRTVVVSDKPLDKLYMNKFRRLGGAKNKKPRDLREDLDEGGTTRTTDRPRHLRDEDEEERRTAKKTTRPNRKFYDEDEDDEEEVEDTGDEETEEEGEDEEEGEEDAAAKKSKFGKEVTGQFDSAAGANLLVFKKKNKFTVVDADDPEKPLKGGADIADKTKVEKFLSKQATSQRQGK